MSRACRHCASETIAGLGSTYLSILCHGTTAQLEQDLIGIENTVGVVPGVTVWCDSCTRISVISFDSYQVSLVRMDPTQEFPKLLPSEYYSKMYRFARFLNTE
jgi:hypothetical protein